MIYHNKEHNFTYVPIPKAGTSTITHLIAPLFDVEPEESINIHLKMVPFQYIGRSPLDTWTFTVVRNPYDRLVSGYKMAMRDDKEGFTNQNLVRQKDFESFVKYLAMVPSRELDEHFRPQWMLLQTDKIEYDYIGKLENMNDVINIISAKLDRNFGMIKLNCSRQDNEFWTPELKKIIYAKFKKDFQTLGYTK